MSVVYHYTDSLHLPWIVASGELRPNLNRLRGIGDIEYLWATTNPAGDRTARALILQKALPRITGEEWWEVGEVAVIRFTLPSAGFAPWSRIKRASTWTAEQIVELEESARKNYGEHGFAKWRCRRKALPLSKVLEVEIYTHSGFEPFKATRKHIIRTNDPATMGFTINGWEYYSQKIDGGPFCWAPGNRELREIWESESEDYF